MNTEVIESSEQKLEELLKKRRELEVGTLRSAFSSRISCAFDFQFYFQQENFYIRVICCAGAVRENSLRFARE